MRATLLVLLVLLVLQGCTSARPEAASPSQSRSAVVHMLAGCPAAGSATGAGDVLPDLSFPCLTGSGTVTPGRAMGVPTVLNLWAPWCAPCREELPLFDRLYAGSGEAVRVLGLVERDTATSSLNYAAEVGLHFPSALDEAGELLADEGLNGLPATYFLRADGSVAHRQIGPITSYDQLRDLVAEHLAVDVPA